MKDLGFQTEIETNLKEVIFLDVTFNLNSGLYKPYKKSNDQLLYVTTSSDHPPQVIKQLPYSINRKLIQNSSNKAIFDASKNEYEEALFKSGYKSNLEFQKEISSEKKTGNAVEILSGSIHHSAKQLRQTLRDYFFAY